MIQRLTPEIEYLAPGLPNALGHAQLLIAGGTFHWSGTGAAQPDSSGITIAALTCAGDSSSSWNGWTRVWRRPALIADLALQSRCSPPQSTSYRQRSTVWLRPGRPCTVRLSASIGVARLSVPRLLVEGRGLAMVPAPRQHCGKLGGPHIGYICPMSKSWGACPCGNGQTPGAGGK